MIGDILTALTQPHVAVGALVACMLTGALFLLNKWQKWWVSIDLLTVARARADDADERVAAITADMDRRIRDAREDGAVRVAQVRADLQAELDRLIKFAESLQRDVESWRLAWNLADQAGGEENDARWNTIVASLTVIERVITGIQRNAAALPRELEADHR